MVQPEKGTLHIDLCILSIYVMQYKIPVSFWMITVQLIYKIL